MIDIHSAYLSQHGIHTEIAGVEQRYQFPLLGRNVYHYQGIYTSLEMIEFLQPRVELEFYRDLRRDAYTFPGRLR